MGLIFRSYVKRSGCIIPLKEVRVLAYHHQYDGRQKAQGFLQNFTTSHDVCACLPETEWGDPQ